MTTPQVVVATSSSHASGHAVAEHEGNGALPDVATPQVLMIAPELKAEEIRKREASCGPPATPRSVATPCRLHSANATPQNSMPYRGMLGSAANGVAAQVAAACMSSPGGTLRQSITPPHTPRTSAATSVTMPPTKPPRVTSLAGSQVGPARATTPRQALRCTGTPRNGMDTPRQASGTPGACKDVVPPGSPRLMGAALVAPTTTASNVPSPRAFMPPTPTRAATPTPTPLPAPNDPMCIHSRSDPCDSFLTSREDSRSPLREDEKLYDEDWWFRHLEERRQGGAPPDSMISGRPEALKCIEETDTGFYMAAPDVAAGGVRLDR